MWLFDVDEKSFREIIVQCITTDNIVDMSDVKFWQPT